MQVKCFECATLIEAPDLEAVADAVVAHAKASHSWTYPEESMRNYARNYAEAVDRIASDTERLSEIGEVTAHPVTAERIDDWLAFFDRDAFAGNPQWASCYCLEPHLPPPQPERPWRVTRAMMAERLRGGGTFGYLAYAGGRPAGWVNASLRADYAIFRAVDPAGPAPASVIGVSCFIIAPPYRQHHIASALLDRVIADAAGRGAAWVEGYPRSKPDANAAAHFRGPRSMYEVRGFEPVEERDNYAVMRLSVAAAALA